MILTPRGKDYCAAVFLTVVTATALNNWVFMAMGLAMALAMIVSILLLAYHNPRSLKVTTSDSVVRAFKNEPVHIEARLNRILHDWVDFTVRSVQRGEGLELREVEALESNLRLTLVPRSAGVFNGVDLVVDVGDPLQLMRTGGLKLHLGTRVESLPLSLIRPPIRVRLSPMALGEQPSGRPGAGQEFYGVGEYEAQRDVRDILWKRVAKSPEGELTVRVREANIPEFVTVQVLVGEVVRGSLAGAIDNVCEAIATIGRGLLEVGSDAVFLAPGGWARRVESIHDLTETVLHIAEVLPHEVDAGETITAAGIMVVMGRHPGWAQITSQRKPVVMVGGDEVVPRGELRLVVFTGKEDLSKVVSWVMEE